MNFLYLLIILTSSLFLSACNPKNSSQNIDMTPITIITNTPTVEITPTITPSTAQNPATDTLISIKTKDGEIVAKLYSSETPNTVANFVKKATSGFYDNLLFHRVEPGFVAQGGDPTGTGMGGGRQKSELNNIPFVRGSFGLARTAETNQISNDSQFFICFTDQGCQNLTSEYVNFGHVVSGLDVLDKIKKGDKIISITVKE